jgi:aspergillopepsin I
MVVLVSALTSVLLAVPALAAPASIIVKKGIRVEAHRYIPSNATINQDTGAVYANFDGGGWVLPVLIGGQQLYLNIDTGSSDM